MTNRRICFREKFLVSVVIFVNKKKKTLNSVVVRWNIKQCCCALVLLLMISSAHYSDQCLYPKRERGLILQSKSENAPGFTIEMSS